MLSIPFTWLFFFGDDVFDDFIDDDADVGVDDIDDVVGDDDGLVISNDDVAFFGFLLPFAGLTSMEAGSFLPTMT